MTHTQTHRVTSIKRILEPISCKILLFKEKKNPYVLLINYISIFPVQKLKYCWFYKTPEYCNDGAGSGISMNVISGSGHPSKPEHVLNGSSTTGLNHNSSVTFSFNSSLPLTFPEIAVSYQTKPTNYSAGEVTKIPSSNSYTESPTTVTTPSTTTTTTTTPTTASVVSNYVVTIKPSPPSITRPATVKVFKKIFI